VPVVVLERREASVLRFHGRPTRRRAAAERNGLLALDDDAEPREQVGIERVETGRRHRAGPVQEDGRLAVERRRDESAVERARIAVARLPAPVATPHRREQPDRQRLRVA